MVARRVVGTQLAALVLAFSMIAVGGQSSRVGAAAADSITVVLWDAPGDDGMSGRAARYDLRYQVLPIIGPDTLSWWNSAVTVAVMPSPGIASATDSVVVGGLDPTRQYYFLLRAADEASNWSGFSDLAVRPVVDIWPPSTITDLRVNE